MLTAPADLLVLPMTGDLTAAISFATACRAAGIRTQLYTEAKKFKAKMSYAGKTGIPFAAFLGEDEISAGTVTVKDLLLPDPSTPQEQEERAAAGLHKQITLPTAEAVSYVKNRLDARPHSQPILDTPALVEKYHLQQP